MNLTDELEKSFAHEPAHRPVEQRIAAGRRLVRRRLALTGLAASALVVVLGGGYAVVSGDGSRGTQAPAADPTDPADQQLTGEVAVGEDGELVVTPGVEILHKVVNPLGFGEPGAAYGVAFRFEGQTRWALVERSGGTYRDAFEAFPTFEYWLEDQVAVQQGRSIFEFVRFGEGEHLEAREGVQLLDQTAEIAHIDGLAERGDPTAVAEVRYDHQRWYVVARDLDDSAPEYFSAAASVTEPTLDEFVTWLEADPWHFDSLR